MEKVNEKLREQAMFPGKIRIFLPINPMVSRSFHFTPMSSFLDIFNAFIANKSSFLLQLLKTFLTLFKFYKGNDTEIFREQTEIIANVFKTI